MKSFKEFLNEMKVYRGVVGKYNKSYKQEITWVSTSREHSEMYTSGDGELIEFNLKKSSLVPLDLGFRSSETEVSFSEISSRLNAEIIKLFKANKLSKEKAINIRNSLNGLKLSGTKQVWEWMHIKDVLDIIKSAGYNAIVQREGLVKHSGDVVTYGIIDKKLLSK